MIKFVCLLACFVSKALSVLLSSACVLLSSAVFVLFILKVAYAGFELTQ